MEPMTGSLEPQLSVVDWWRELPSADAEGGDSGNTPLPDLRPIATERSTSSRRSVVKALLGTGIGLSLGMLDAVSGLRLKFASATVGNEYTNCSIYGGWWGYHNNTYVCVGGYYSWWYCGTDGWFKHYSVSGQQFYPVRACNNRNAWRWSHAPYRYRCADGRYRYFSNGQWYSTFRICSQWIGYA